MFCPSPFARQTDTYSVFLILVHKSLLLILMRTRVFVTRLLSLRLIFPLPHHREHKYSVSVCGNSFRSDLQRVAIVDSASREWWRHGVTLLRAFSFNPDHFHITSRHSSPHSPPLGPGINYSLRLNNIPVVMKSQNQNRTSIRSPATPPLPFHHNQNEWMSSRSACCQFPPGWIRFHNDPRRLSRLSPRLFGCLDDAEVCCGAVWDIYTKCL
jgi:hypothetical protein